MKKKNIAVLYNNIMSITTAVPIIDTNLQHESVFTVSPLNSNFTPFVALSHSQNSSVISIIPPSPSIFMSPCILLKQRVTIDFTGTTTGLNLLEAGYTALRGFSLSSIQQSVSLSMQNQNYSFLANELVHPLMEYQKLAGENTVAAYYRDSHSRYRDGVLSINNPLATYSDAVGSEFLQRGAYPLVSITNGATTAQLVYDIYEPMLIPPLQMTTNSLGFSNLTTSVTLNIQYVNNLSYIVSHANTNATFSNITVTLSTPTAFVKFASPHDGYVPRPLKYDNHVITPYSTPYGSSVSAGASFTMASQNIMFQSMPESILIFARRQNADRTYLTTDTYCSPDNISITFNNVSGILSTASKADLFNVCVSNGLQRSWAEFNGVVTNSAMAKVGLSGAVLRLKMGKDIPIGNHYVGESGSFNFQLSSATFTNVNQSDAVTPVLYVVAMYKSTIQIDTTGAVSSTIDQPIPSDNYVPYETLHQNGAGFFSDAIRTVGKALPGINKFLRDNKVISGVSGLVSSIPSPVSGVANTISSIANQLGYGGMQVGGMQVGGMGLSQEEIKRRAELLGDRSKKSHKKR